MTDYPAHMILTLRQHLEEDGDPNPDLAARQWCEQGWADPSAAYREWTAIGATDPDVAWELRQAGLNIETAGREVEVDGVTATVAAHYIAERLTLDEAKQAAGVDPLADLQRLAKDRAAAEHALTEIRRLGRVKAIDARRQGASVADIADAFGVSRQGAYDLLGD